MPISKEVDLHSQRLGSLPKHRMIKKVSTYENIEEVNIEYNVENVQTKVEEVAIGILLVSRYVLILDKP